MGGLRGIVGNTFTRGILGSVGDVAAHSYHAVGELDTVDRIRLQITSDRMARQR